MTATIISGNSQYAEFAFETIMAMAGGADKYSENTKGAIWMECLRNKNIQRLVGLYLAGSSERAERNLKNLRAEIYSVFLEGR